MLINPAVRLVTAILVLAGGVVFGLGGRWGFMAVALAIGGILVFLHFRLGLVFFALQQLYRGNTRKAEKYLGRIKYPDRLSPSRRGYYHFCRGYLTMQQNKSDEARRHFEQALDDGLRLQNDNAVAHVSMAQLYLQENQLKQVKQHLSAARALKHNEEVSRAIEEVAGQIGSRAGQ